MKLVLSLAAMAAVLMVFSTARAVEDPPDPHVQLVEVEQMTPYLESSIQTATSTTVSRIVRTSGAGFSSQAYAQFDNHNPDLSRATFPLEVEDGDLYGVSAVFAQGPNFGVVQVAIDGQPLGSAVRFVRGGRGCCSGGVAGHACAGRGQAHADADGHGQERRFDRLPGRARSHRARLGGGRAADADGGGDGRGGRHRAGDVGAVARRFADVRARSCPGVTREYTASTTANVVSSAGDATLTRSSDPRAPHQRRVLAAGSRCGWNSPRRLGRRRCPTIRSR